MSLTDRTIREAQEGGIRARADIYREYSDFVWNVALKISGSRSAAEDITEEVFVKVFRKLKRFRFRSSFGTWIYRVTVNTALNYRKKENRRSSFQLNEDLAAAEDESRTDDLAAREMASRLLGILSHRERVLVVLKELEGLSFKDIAAASKLNGNTVKTIVYRARDKMRQEYLRITDGEDENTR